ncbi:MAG: ABC transporter ATP-binding protein [Actinobacteria bacterium]|nr:ABC transporter ATP-binding protein [Actinomycetota bacterium]
MVNGLEVVDLCVTYEGESLLSHLTVHVGDEIVALLGPSGSGKSTLLRCIAGVQQPDTGRIAWNGDDLLTVPAHQRGIGLVFQDPLLFPHLTVSRNISFGTKDNSRVTELLSLIRMSGYADRRPETLSGGEAQRVALARALAPQPRMLLLDEPFGSLDTDWRRSLTTEVRELLKSTHTPAIHVTHDEDEAFAIADRVVHLADLQRSSPF